MTHKSPPAYREWLENHLKEATAEFNRVQALDDEVGNDEDLYEKVHQMWGYLAGLEKCLKQLKALGKSPI